MRYAPLLLSVLLLAVAAAGAEPEKNDHRRLARWLQVDPPFEHLRLADGVQLAEGHHGMQDRFPFLVAAKNVKHDRKEGWALTPKNLGHFLKKENGQAIRDAGQATEAARLFAAGFLVRDAETAERIVATVPKLPKIPYPAKVHDYRPKLYGPFARKTDAGWTVDLVVLRVTGRAQLVHVTAKVTPAAEITYEEKLIVDGPQLSWQVGWMDGEPTSEELEKERRERAAVRTALAMYLRALKPEPTEDNVWAAARGLSYRGDVEAAFGKPQREWGAQVTMCQYAQPGKRTITFGYPGPDAKPREGPVPLREVVVLRSEQVQGVTATIAKVYRSSGAGR